MRGSSLLLILGFAFGAGCARTPGRPPLRTYPKAVDLHELAARIDDPSAARLWPQVPASLQARATARIPANLTEPARLRVGTDWLNVEHLREACGGGEPHEQFLKFLAGYAMIEELAWSPTSGKRADAMGALYDRLRDEPFWPDLRTPIHNLAKSLPAFTGQRVDSFDSQIEREFCRGPTLGLIRDNARRLGRHFAAELLRGGPSGRTARILRDEAEELTFARDFSAALPLLAEVARQRPGDPDAWLDLAKGNYRAGWSRQGDVALKRSIELGAESAAPAVREATWLGAVAHRLDEPAATLEQSLARFWALFEIRRLDEARALIDRLREQRPHDGRVLVGHLWLKCTEARATGWFEAAHDAYLTLTQARGLTALDGDYARFYLSVAFTEVMAARLHSSMAKRKEPDAATVASAQRMRSLCKQFASQVPAEAALFELALDALEMVCDHDCESGPRGAQGLGQLFPRARALYNRYPGALTYRLMLALATAHDDKAAAYAAIRAPLRFDLAGDDEVALLRARAFVTVAFRWKDWGELMTLTALVPDVPRWSDDIRDRLAIVEGDANLLRAAGGDPTFWKHAMKAYAFATGPVPTEDRDRTSNNGLAIADLLLESDDTADGWWSLLQAREPEWPVLVNAAAAAFRAGRRAEAVAILQSRKPDSDDHRPGVVDEWLACLTGQGPKPPAGAGAPGDRPAFTVFENELGAGNIAPSWTMGNGLTDSPHQLKFEFTVTRLPWLVASPQACWGARPPSLAATPAPP